MANYDIIFENAEIMKDLSIAIYEAADNGEITAIERDMFLESLAAGAIPKSPAFDAITDKLSSIKKDIDKFDSVSADNDVDDIYDKVNAAYKIIAKMNGNKELNTFDKIKLRNLKTSADKVYNQCKSAGMKVPSESPSSVLSKIASAVKNGDAAHKILLDYISKLKV